MSDLTCDEVFDAAPQFALDILEPARRSRVAAHLIRCPRCRATISEMQESAAALLDLDGADWSRAPIGGAPAEGDPWSGPVEPTEVVSRTGRRRLRIVVTLAAAALLMVGTTLGPEIEAARNRPAAPIARAELLDGGNPVGYVNFYSGSQPSLDLQVTGISARGSVICESLNLDGTVTRLGSFGLYQGHAYWAFGGPFEPGRMSSLMLVDGQGRVLASTSMATAVS